MRIGIPKEVAAGERRVAATPATVEKYRKLGFEVAIEAGAGESAWFADEAYRKAGAEIVPDAAALYGSADIVLKVRPPTEEEADRVKEGALLIGFLWPAQNKALVDRLAARKASALAMDAVPRITRAQKMDALSSTANLAGYRAVIEAASRFGRLFSGQITAAGRIDPAKVLVIGAGVAGLAAVATAKNLGAVVRAFDTRSAVREQVQSLGASFLEVNIEEDGEGGGGYAKVMSKAFIEAEMALFAAQAREVDVIVTTALIPGKPAPKLITAEMVRSMKPGSVIVDLAAEQGGNCELTVPGEIVVREGVTLIGITNFPSYVPNLASQLYATNVYNLFETVGKDNAVAFHLDDEVVRGAIILKDGEWLWPPPPAPKKEAPAPVAAAKPAEKAPPPPPPRWRAPALWGAAGLAFLLTGFFAPPDFLQHFTVFLLACVVGWHVVWSVTPALHTPLMSVTNAISGIIVVGGMLLLPVEGTAPRVLAALAVLLAMINVSGGFLVTQRMLKMFHK